MKKYAAFLLTFLMFQSVLLFGQSRKETHVKLEWHEQGFVHFYTPEYTVYVSKPEFLNIQNELLIGLFDEYAQKEDSIDLKNPFSEFKTEQQSLLWEQLKGCAKEGHMLILSNRSKRKLKNVLIIDESIIHGETVVTWECRDPKNNHVIFAHQQQATSAPDF